MARLLSRHGLLSKQDMAQAQALCEPPPVYTAKEVAQIRTRNARMSQAVFADFLNVSASTVQKWESESSGKRPSGSAAKLLQIIEARGIEAILV
jgi:putative transcriptional regulator